MGLKVWCYKEHIENLGNVNGNIKIKYGYIVYTPSPPPPKMCPPMHANSAVSLDACKYNWSPFLASTNNLFFVISLSLFLSFPLFLGVLLALAYQGKDIVFRFIIESSS
jgi:hypothetical protein